MASDDQAPAEALTISGPDQYRALSHPARHRLLYALGQAPATISQLAVALDSKKGSVAHHLKVLREAGLVAVTQTRQVRGGTEQYYQRTARRLVVRDDTGGEQTAVLLRAVAGELAGATAEPVLTLRNLRLTEAQAGKLARTLTELADGLQDAGPGEPRYGLLVGLWRPRQPDPDSGPPALSGTPAEPPGGCHTEACRPGRTGG
jgi:DNA-binding transcriptional ArsR family regulator